MLVLFDVRVLPLDYLNYCWMSNTEVHLKSWFQRIYWKPSVSLLGLMSGSRKLILSVWGKSPGSLISLNIH